MDMWFEEQLMKLESEATTKGIDLETMVSAYEMRKMALDEQIEEAQYEEED